LIVTLDEAKLWLKIDYDDDDDDVQVLIDASEAYLLNATGNTFDNTNALAKLFCRILIGDWYENRAMIEDKKLSEKVRFTVQSIMMQLQYSDGIAP
jgi:uncharacterized phage protein (predicted DNA packaging)